MSVSHFNIRSLQAYEPESHNIMKAIKVSSIINAEVDFNIKFPSQVGLSHQGIGLGSFNPNSTASERRKLVT